MPDFTAGIFIINNKDEILLSHATHSPNKYWGIPKGMVDKDESYLDAAVREVEEETSIKILNSDMVMPLGVMKYTSGNKSLVAYYLFLEDLSQDEIVLIGKYDFNFIDETTANNKIENIDLKNLWCRSIVQPRKDGELPFPEVDKYSWVNPSLAEEILYKPQKALLPKLLDVINSRRNGSF